MLRSFLSRWIGIAAVGTAVAAVYWRMVRPWHLHWGATDAEAQQPMPGDALIPAAGLVATRAITVRAPVEAVWPWLVQMGYGRAGWYSYDALDNAGVHTERIIPELQQLQVGDTLHTDPTGGFRVEAIEPQRLLLLMLHPDTPDRGSAISVALLLVALDEQHTRLIVRLRARFQGLRGRLFGALFDLGDFVMMRKMLLGIRHRAQAAVEHQLPL